jgi:hypothetical protein
MHRALGWKRSCVLFDTDRVVVGTEGEVCKQRLPAIMSTQGREERRAMNHLPRPYRGSCRLTSGGRAEYLLDRLERLAFVAPKSVNLGDGDLHESIAIRKFRERSEPRQCCVCSVHRSTSGAPMGVASSRAIPRTYSGVCVTSSVHFSGCGCHPSEEACSSRDATASPSFKSKCSRAAESPES